MQGGPARQARADPLRALTRRTADYRPRGPESGVPGGMVESEGGAGGDMPGPDGALADGVLSVGAAPVPDGDGGLCATGLMSSSQTWSVGACRTESAFASAICQAPD